MICSRVFLAAVVLSWLLTKRILVRWKKKMDPTERLLLGVCVFAAVFFIVAGISIAAASVYRHFSREVGSAISETVDAFEEAREEASNTEETVTKPPETVAKVPEESSPDQPTVEPPDVETVDMLDETIETDAGPSKPVVEYPEGTTFTGTRVEMGSGNGFTLELEDGTRIGVRLAGVHAPERGQYFWGGARKALGARSKNTVKVVTVVKGSVADGVIGLVYLGEDCINTWMVREGWAWYHPEHYESEALAAAQEEARRSKRGLWVNPDPLAPWEWLELCKIDDSTRLTRKEVYGMYYKVIGVEDASVVPLNFLRKTYGVFVRPAISESHLRAILFGAIQRQMRTNPDVDAIIVLAYEETEQGKRGVAFTPIGMVGWAPDGKWDNVSAEIARTNDRSSYKYYIEISDEFMKTANQDDPSEDQTHKPVKED